MYLPFHTKDLCYILVIGLLNTIIGLCHINVSFLVIGFNLKRSGQIRSLRVLSLLVLKLFTLFLNRISSKVKLVFILVLKHYSGPVRF